ncbi:MAG TPA: hypothetical protein VGI39_42115 [Polyangiaceae bacterium]|jgi:hypothetical protein
MFIGHYGVALAAKRAAPRTSLATFFVAAQLLDVLLALFVVAGVEKFRIVPGFTKTTPFDLTFVPYSHSLAATVLWSALAALVYGLAASGSGDKKARVTAALVVGAVVASHFLLDFPMHVPDLPLGFDAGSPKVGLGLWDQLDVSLVLEVSVLVAGGALYLGATRPREGSGAAPTIVVALVLLALAAAAPFVPPPGGPTEFSAQALGAFAVLALLALWVDRSREAFA